MVAERFAWLTFVIFYME